MTIDTATPIPSRFRAAEERGARIGRVLRSVGRIDEVDEELMGLIGRRFMQRDEVGAALATAIRDRGDVTMRQFQQALVHGIENVKDAPPALRTFFAHVDAVPEWVDMDLVNEGARVYRTYGQNSADVLLQLSLIGGYRFGGPTDLLVATGGLAGGMTKRRLGETQKWGIALSEHDAMHRSGEGFQLTVHVRLMHAMVNQRFSTGDRWDVDTWGLPINQSDQAATLGLFNATLLLGVRALGVRVPRADSRAVMHLWKYVGWLMGVNEDWLFDSEREQHRFNYHVLLAQSDVTAAGPQLANAIIDAQDELHFAHFEWLSRRYGRERLLSMLRVFLGKDGLTDLRLPSRLPWAVALIIPANFLRYHLIGRTSWGRGYLERRGSAVRRRLLARYFGADAPEIGRISQD
ncbi:oxygenase MpaB family protein [Aeromicrobium sp. P5_D10]